MSSEPNPRPPARRPWWQRNRSQIAVLALVVLALLLLPSLLEWLGWTVWLVALAVLTTWLLAPDLTWAWREHPAVVKRVLRYLTHPRTVRVLLYLLLAYAWWVTLL